MYFEREHGSKVNNSPFFLSLMSPSLVPSLSSVIHSVLPEDSQEAGNRSRGNNREKRKEDGQKER